MNRKAYLKRGIQLMVLSVSIFLLISGHLWAEEEHQPQKLGFFDVLLRPRVWVGALFCVAGLLLLMKAKVTRQLRVAMLGLAFFAFAVLAALPLGEFAKGMGLHPSPVCTITKPFLFVNAGRSVPIVFPAILFSIAVFSIAGNKLFCGWVCPIGALQELAYEVPLPRKRKFKLPFKVTNWIRVALFVIFVPLVFIIGKETYAYINPFEALHWGFELAGFTVLLVVIIAALFTFRPFCYVVCPMGLFTWLCEHVSLVRIKVDPDKCIECYNCVDETPCPAMDAIVAGKRSRPDCHACGKCLSTCDEGAIHFQIR
jgi:polyferredoxin